MLWGLFTFRLLHKVNYGDSMLKLNRGDLIIYNVCQFLGRKVHVAEDNGVIMYLGSPHEDYNVMLKDLKLSPEDLPEGDLSWFQALIDDYEGGGTQIFDVSVKFVAGTPFQRAVWEELRRIPSGTSISYSVLADRIGRPTAIRAVASAVGSNPIMLLVPCHRVIGKDGSQRGFRGGIDLKEELQFKEKSADLF